MERLGTAIKLGLLEQGSQLPPERELADRLGISRSTLRQALTTLVQGGYLVSRRGRGGGTFVADNPPTTSDGDDLMGPAVRGVLDLRVAVEMGSVLLAAERGGAREHARLDTLVGRMADADGFDEYRRADMQWHIGLAEAAGSPRLVRAMTNVQSQMSDLIARIPHPEEVLTRSNAQHRRIVTLLRHGDATAAMELLRIHIAGTEHLLAGLMAPPGRG